MIFVEVPRGEKGKPERKPSRLKTLEALYAGVEENDLRNCPEELASLGDEAENKLQSDRLFLYFAQLGRSMYTGEPISIESILSGNGVYNIEHIYPQSAVKDDSVFHNIVLVESLVNGQKKDTYPISSAIRTKMTPYWKKLNRYGLLTDEKLRRLTRSTPFTPDERFDFLNRQLVETGQAAKAVTTLLRERYPSTEVVYVKGGHVSDFRKEFKMVKSRAVNDLHHAKDAYLNIVAGCVWHYKYSKRFFCSDDAENTAKVESLYSHPVTVGKRTIWRGGEDLALVRKIVAMHTPHLTMYPICRHSGQNGGLFDQNLLPAAEGLVPRKKGLPSEKYGGYNKPTVSFFTLVRYRLGKRTEVSFLPILLLHADKFRADDNFALQYAKDMLDKKAEDIEFPLGKREIKIWTTLSLDGLRVTLRGKGSDKQLGFSVLSPLRVDWETEQYIKKLESFCRKREKNKELVWNETFDDISKEKNTALYDLLCAKLLAPPYCKRPGASALFDTLTKNGEHFLSLPPEEQAIALLRILPLFGNGSSADLSILGAGSQVGTVRLSLNLSNWKKSYTDVRIIDTSASGLYEKRSVNLLSLL